MNDRNRIYNAKNPYQGESKRVLCVCSAGLLRSPTVAVVLSAEPYNYNTRAAGINSSYALIPVDDVLLIWADEVVCMTPDQKEILEAKLMRLGATATTLFCLNIPDNYAYRDPKLIKEIKMRYGDPHEC